MDRQFELEREAYQSWCEFTTETPYDVPEWKLYDLAFKKGYELGTSRAPAPFPGTAKKVDRTMLAAMAMQGILSNQHQVDYACCDVYGGEMPKAVAQYAVACADALIAELKKEAK